MSLPPDTEREGAPRVGHTDFPSAPFGKGTTRGFVADADALAEQGAGKHVDREPFDQSLLLEVFVALEGQERESAAGEVYQLVWDEAVLPHIYGGQAVFFRLAVRAYVAQFFFFQQHTVGVFPCIRTGILLPHRFPWGLQRSA